MKRRNFLSGLLAVPLAIKARLARFFAPKRVPQLTPRQLEICRLLATSGQREDPCLRRGLRRGDKGPHVLLNPR